MNDIPDIVRSAAYAAFAGQPADEAGVYELPETRAPWDALEDALAAALPVAERRVREQIVDELVPIFQAMRENGDTDMRTVIHHVRNITRGAER